MSTEDTPKPAAWTFGASYWTRAESIPLAIIAQAEPLFDQATIDAAVAAAVAKERERCARAVVDYSLSYPFDENDRSLFDECAQYVRDGVLPSA